MKWSPRIEMLSDGRVMKVTHDPKVGEFSVADAVRAWQKDPAFVAAFVELLRDAPFSAFRWETPSVTTTTASRPFEFVLVDSPGLAVQPDSTAFADHFRSDTDVVTFPNLGGDAVLVVPCPHGDEAVYGHLAAFIRRASEDQIQSLLRSVGMAMAQRIGSKPVWLNTAGAGVPWLHIRLDDRPKYYHYSPYR